MTGSLPEGLYELLRTWRLDEAPARLAELNPEWRIGLVNDLLARSRPRPAECSGRSDLGTRRARELGL